MTTDIKSVSIQNGQAMELRDIPKLSVKQFREVVIESVQNGARISSFFGRSAPEKSIELMIVLADEKEGMLSLCSTNVKREYPSLTPECPQAHWFEREIAEQWGIRPEGHPWLKPIRFHPHYQSGQDLWNRTSVLPGVTHFYEMYGEEIHEVAVGPVHAGIIEPGHFRFQCHGENVFHLEISLGYQHRGVEKALIGGPNKRTVHYIETLSGDTSVGHALAYAQAIEALGVHQISARAEILRAISLELERLANHTGDLGALANDIGFLPTASYCGRIRGDFLNMTALICGNRFGRGLIIPGGTGFDLDQHQIDQLRERLEKASKDITIAVNLLWNEPSVSARFEDTGIITQKTCEDLGLVGPPARACGIERDVRSQFPCGIFRFSQISVSTWHSGDVFARAYVRWLEIQRSIAFIFEHLKLIPEGSIFLPYEELIPDQIVVSMTEGWRGEICHAAITDKQGRFSTYKITDPSFHNWMGLAMALRNQQISDFPLCNKSFDLSYCGHDL